MAFVCRKLLIGAGVVMRQALKMATTPTSTSPIVRTTTPSSSSSLKVLGSYIESHSRVRPPTIIVILLLITFFLVGFLSIYLRRCYAHQHSTPPHHLSTTAQYQYHSHSQQGLVALAPTHHTAFVGSPKLPPRCNHIDLDSLPKLTFSSLPRSPPPSSSSSSSSSPSPPSSPLAPSVASLERQTECAICLEVFEDGVELCYLPLCGHLFHPDCIHMWLFTHTSCPLCRHSLRLLDPPSDGNATAAQPAPLPDHHYPSNRGDD